MKKIDIDSIPVPARRLRELLKVYNITQRELAERIHVDTRYISMIACGTRGLSMDMASRIAECFPGTRRQWLLGLDEYQTEDARTVGVIRFHLNYADVTMELIKSHGYMISRYVDSQHRTFFEITAPTGESKTIPALQYDNLVSRINDYVEGELLLGFHKIKDGAKEYTGRCF